MAPNPKLVEALAELVAAWSQKCPIDHVETTVANDIRHDCQKFFDRYRIVQLPEEPSGWVDMEDDILLWGYTGPNDGMTPFYTPNGGIDDADCILLDFGIPGDPQEVDDD